MGLVEPNADKIQKANLQIRGQYLNLLKVNEAIEFLVHDRPVDSPEVPPVTSLFEQVRDRLLQHQDDHKRSIYMPFPGFEIFNLRRKNPVYHQLLNARFRKFLAATTFRETDYNIWVRGTVGLYNGSKNIVNILVMSKLFD